MRTARSSGRPRPRRGAGLGRSRYQEAQDQLVHRGLVDVDVRATGRGRTSTLSLAFAAAGPWWEGDINVQLLEAVLGYSHATEPARLLLATLAAIADENRTVRDLATAEPCGAAGMTDKTYRRARQMLLLSGEIVLVSSGIGGRGNTNVRTVSDSRLRDGASPARAARRVPPPLGARPLVATTRPGTAAEPGSPHASHAVVKGGQDRTVSNCPAPETPAETPAPNARAGKEPQNPRIKKTPPPPLQGGARRAR